MKINNKKIPCYKNLLTKQKNIACQKQIQNYIKQMKNLMQLKTCFYVFKINL